MLCPSQPSINFTQVNGVLDNISQLKLPVLNPKFLSSDARTNKCLHIFKHVRSTNKPNYAEARLPLPQNFNIPAWRQHLNFKDSYNKLLDYMEFGWPINYTANTQPVSATGNHHSAQAFSSDIDTYIIKEQTMGSLIGPFTLDSLPFEPWVQLSALMTVPKKESADRRTILDLSWPIGHSVNDGIPRDIYDGSPSKLKLPTADDLVNLIVEAGPGCFLYSRDLARGQKRPFRLAAIVF